MKTILILFALAACMLSCNKNKSGTTCNTAEFTYEVILDTPVPAGSMQVTYADAQGTYHEDTSITSTWTVDIENITSSTPILYLAITPGPNYADYLPANTNLTTSATLNIYREGALVETTGVNQFCQQNGTVACTAPNTLEKSHVCMD